MNIIEKLLSGVHFSKGPLKGVRFKSERDGRRNNRPPRSDLYPPTPKPISDDDPKGDEGFERSLSMDEYRKRQQRKRDEESARSAARETRKTSGLHGKSNKYLIKLRED